MSHVRHRDAGTDRHLHRCPAGLRPQEAPGSGQGLGPRPPSPLRPRVISPMADDKMPFLSHLEELRRRLIVSLIAIAIGFVLSFQFSEEIMGILKRILTTTFAFQRTYPYVVVVAKAAPQLIFVAPAEAFWAHIKIGFLDRKST